MKCTRAVPFDTVSPSLNMIFSTVPARGARITYCEKEWKNRKHLKAYAPEVSFHRNDLRYIPHPPIHTHTHMHACTRAMLPIPAITSHTHTHMHRHTHTHVYAHTHTHTQTLSYTTHTTNADAHTQIKE